MRSETNITEVSTYTLVKGWLDGAGTHAIWSDEYTLSNLSSGVTSGQLRVAVYNHNTLLPDGLIGAPLSGVSEKFRLVVLAVATAMFAD